MNIPNIESSSADHALQSGPNTVFAPVQIVQTYVIPVMMHSVEDVLLIILVAVHLSIDVKEGSTRWRDQVRSIALLI